MKAVAASAAAAALSFLAAVASANFAYQFSEGHLSILGAEPLRTFSCNGRAYGYYADVSTNCQVFHVCLPITDDEGEVEQTAHFSFFCGNQTTFSQESLSCAHPDQAFPCERAEALYNSSNADFGTVPQRDL